jgi:hypothetical protein
MQLNAILLGANHRNQNNVQSEKGSWIPLLALWDDALEEVHLLALSLMEYEP